MALTREGLLEYMGTRFGVEHAEIDDGTALFSSGLLDSFSMVDLILFIEKQTAVRLNPMDITLENLDSVGRILNLAESKVQANGN